MAIDRHGRIEPHGELADRRLLVQQLEAVPEVTCLRALRGGALLLALHRTGKGKCCYLVPELRGLGLVS